MEQYNSESYGLPKRKSSFSVDLGPNDPIKLNVFSKYLRKSYTKLKTSRFILLVKSCSTKFRLNQKQSRHAQEKETENGEIPSRIVLDHSVFTLKKPKRLLPDESDSRFQCGDFGSIHDYVNCKQSHLSSCSEASGDNKLKITIENDVKESTEFYLSLCNCLEKQRKDRFSREEVLFKNYYTIPTNTNFHVFPIKVELPFLKVSKDASPEKDDKSAQCCLKRKTTSRLTDHSDKKSKTKDLGKRRKVGFDDIPWKEDFGPAAKKHHLREKIQDNSLYVYNVCMHGKQKHSHERKHHSDDERRASTPKEHGDIIEPADRKDHKQRVKAKKIKVRTSKADCKRKPHVFEKNFVTYVEITSDEIQQEKTSKDNLKKLITMYKEAITDTHLSSSKSFSVIKEESTENMLFIKNEEVKSSKSEITSSSDSLYFNKRKRTSFLNGRSGEITELSEIYAITQNSSCLSKPKHEIKYHLADRKRNSRTSNQLSDGENAWSKLISSTCTSLTKESISNLNHSLDCAVLPKILQLLAKNRSNCIDHETQYESFADKSVSTDLSFREDSENSIEREVRVYDMEGVRRKRLSSRTTSMLAKKEEKSNLDSRSISFIEERVASTKAVNTGKSLFSMNSLNQDNMDESTITDLTLKDLEKNEKRLDEMKNQEAVALLELKEKEEIAARRKHVSTCVSKEFLPEIKVSFNRRRDAKYKKCTSETFTENICPLRHSDESGDSDPQYLVEKKLRVPIEEVPLCQVTNDSSATKVKLDDTKKERFPKFIGYSIYDPITAVKKPNQSYSFNSASQFKKQIPLAIKSVSKEERISKYLNVQERNNQPNPSKNIKETRQKKKRILKPKISSHITHKQSDILTPIKEEGPKQGEIINEPINTEPVDQLIKKIRKECDFIETNILDSSKLLPKKTETVTKLFPKELHPKKTDTNSKLFTKELLPKKTDTNTKLFAKATKKELKMEENKEPEEKMDLFVEDEKNFEISESNEELEESESANEIKEEAVSKEYFGVHESTLKEESTEESFSKEESSIDNIPVKIVASIEERVSESKTINKERPFPIIQDSFEMFHQSNVSIETDISGKNFRSDRIRSDLREKTTREFVFPNKLELPFNDSKSKENACQTTSKISKTTSKVHSVLSSTEQSFNIIPSINIFRPEDERSNRNLNARKMDRKQSRIPVFSKQLASSTNKNKQPSNNSNNLEEKYTTELRNLLSIDEKQDELTEGSEEVAGKMDESTATLEKSETEIITSPQEIIAITLDSDCFDLNSMMEVIKFGGKRKDHNLHIINTMDTLDIDSVNEKRNKKEQKNNKILEEKRSKQIKIENKSDLLERRHQNAKKKHEEASKENWKNGEKDRNKDNLDVEEVFRAKVEEEQLVSLDQRKNDESKQKLNNLKSEQNVIENKSQSFSLNEEYKDEKKKYVRDINLLQNEDKQNEGEDRKVRKGDGEGQLVSLVQEKDEWNNFSSEKKDIQKTVGEDRGKNALKDESKEKQSKLRVDKNKSEETEGEQIVFKKEEEKTNKLKNDSQTKQLSEAENTKQQLKNSPKHENQLPRGKLVTRSKSELENVNSKHRKNIASQKENKTELKKKTEVHNNKLNGADAQSPTDILKETNINQDHGKDLQVTYINPVSFLASDNDSTEGSSMYEGKKESLKTAYLNPLVLLPLHSERLDKNKTIKQEVVKGTTRKEERAKVDEVAAGRANPKNVDLEMLFKRKKDDMPLVQELNSENCLRKKSSRTVKNVAQIMETRKLFAIEEHEEIVVTERTDTVDLRCFRNEIPDLTSNFKVIQDNRSGTSSKLRHVNQNSVTQRTFARGFARRDSSEPERKTRTLTIEDYFAKSTSIHPNFIKGIIRWISSKLYRPVNSPIVGITNDTNICIELSANQISNFFNSKKVNLCKLLNLLTSYLKQFLTTTKIIIIKADFFSRTIEISILNVRLPENKIRIEDFNEKHQTVNTCKVLTIRNFFEFHGTVSTTSIPKNKTIASLESKKEALNQTFDKQTSLIRLEKVSKLSQNNRKEFRLKTFPSKLRPIASQFKNLRILKVSIPEEVETSQSENDMGETTPAFKELAPIETTVQKEKTEETVSEIVSEIEYKKPSQESIIKSASSSIPSFDSLNKYVPRALPDFGMKKGIKYEITVQTSRSKQETFPIGLIPKESHQREIRTRSINEDLKRMKQKESIEKPEAIHKMKEMKEEKLGEEKIDSLIPTIKEKIIKSEPEVLERNIPSLDRENKNKLKKNEEKKSVAKLAEVPIYKMKETEKKNLGKGVSVIPTIKPKTIISDDGKAKVTALIGKETEVLDKNIPSLDEKTQNKLRKNGEEESVTKPAIKAIHKMKETEEETLGKEKRISLIPTTKRKIIKPGDGKAKHLALVGIESEVLEKNISSSDEENQNKLRKNGEKKSIANPELIPIHKWKEAEEEKIGKEKRISLIPTSKQKILKTHYDKHSFVGKESYVFEQNIINKDGEDFDQNIPILAEKSQNILQKKLKDVNFDETSIGKEKIPHKTGRDTLIQLSKKPIIRDNEKIIDLKDIKCPSGITLTFDENVLDSLKADTVSKIRKDFIEINLGEDKRKLEEDQNYEDHKIGEIKTIEDFALKLDNEEFPFLWSKETIRPELSKEVLVPKKEFGSRKMPDKKEKIEFKEIQTPESSLSFETHYKITIKPDASELLQKSILSDDGSVSRKAIREDLEAKSSFNLKGIEASTVPPVISSLAVDQKSTETLKSVPSIVSFEAVEADEHRLEEKLLPDRLVLSKFQDANKAIDGYSEENEALTIPSPTVFDVSKQKNSETAVELHQIRESEKDEMLPRKSFKLMKDHTGIDEGFQDSISSSLDIVSKGDTKCIETLDIPLVEEEGKASSKTFEGKDGVTPTTFLLSKNEDIGELDKKNLIGLKFFREDKKDDEPKQIDEPITQASLNVCKKLIQLADKTKNINEVNFMKYRNLNSTLEELDMNQMATFLRKLYPILTSTQTMLTQHPEFIICTCNVPNLEEEEEGKPPAQVVDVVQEEAAPFYLNKSIEDKEGVPEKIHQLIENMSLHIVLNIPENDDLEEDQNRKQVRRTTFKEESMQQTDLSNIDRKHKIKVKTSHCSTELLEDDQVVPSSVFMSSKRKSVDKEMNTDLDQTIRNKSRRPVKYGRREKRTQSKKKKNAEKRPICLCSVPSELINSVLAKRELAKQFQKCMCGHSNDFICRCHSNAEEESKTEDTIIPTKVFQENEAQTDFFVAEKIMGQIVINKSNQSVLLMNQNEAYETNRDTLINIDFCLKKCVKEETSIHHSNYLEQTKNSIEVISEEDTKYEVLDAPSNPIDEYSSTYSIVAELTQNLIDFVMKDQEIVEEEGYDAKFIRDSEESDRNSTDGSNFTISSSNDTSDVVPIVSGLIHGIIDEFDESTSEEISETINFIVEKMSRLLNEHPEMLSCSCNVMALGNQDSSDINVAGGLEIPEEAGSSSRRDGKKIRSSKGNGGEPSKKRSRKPSRKHKSRRKKEDVICLYIPSESEESDEELLVKKDDENIEEDEEIEEADKEDVEMLSKEESKHFFTTAYFTYVPWFCKPSKSLTEQETFNILKDNTTSYNDVEIVSKGEERSSKVIFDNIYNEKPTNSSSRHPKKEFRPPKCICPDNKSKCKKSKHDDLECIPERKDSSVKNKIPKFAAIKSKHISDESISGEVLLKKMPFACNFNIPASISGLPSKMTCDVKHYLNSISKHFHFQNKTTANSFENADVRYSIEEKQSKNACKLKIDIKPPNKVEEGKKPAAAACNLNSIHLEFEFAGIMKQVEEKEKSKELLDVFEDAPPKIGKGCKCGGNSERKCDCSPEKSITEKEPKYKPSKKSSSVKTLLSARRKRNKKEECACSGSTKEDSKYEKSRKKETKFAKPIVEDVRVGSSIPFFRRKKSHPKKESVSKKDIKSKLINVCVQSSIADNLKAMQDVKIETSPTIQLCACTSTYSCSSKISKRKASVQIQEEPLTDKTITTDSQMREAQERVNVSIPYIPDEPRERSSRNDSETYEIETKLQDFDKYNEIETESAYFDPKISDVFKTEDFDEPKPLHDSVETLETISSVTGSKIKIKVPSTITWEDVGAIEREKVLMVTPVTTPEIENAEQSQLKVDRDLMEVNKRLEKTLTAIANVNEEHDILSKEYGLGSEVPVGYRKPRSSLEIILGDDPLIEEAQEKGILPEDPIMALEIMNISESGKDVNTEDIPQDEDATNIHEQSTKILESDSQNEDVGKKFASDQDGPIKSELDEPKSQTDELQENPASDDKNDTKVVQTVLTSKLDDSKNQLDGEDEEYKSFAAALKKDTDTNTSSVEHFIKTVEVDGKEYDDEEETGFTSDQNTIVEISQETLKDQKETENTVIDATPEEKMVEGDGNEKSLPASLSGSENKPFSDEKIGKEQKPSIVKVDQADTSNEDECCNMHSNSLNVGDVESLGSNKMYFEKIANKRNLSGKSAPTQLESEKIKNKEYELYYFTRVSPSQPKVRMRPYKEYFPTVFENEEGTHFQDVFINREIETEDRSTSTQIIPFATYTVTPFDLIFVKETWSDSVRIGDGRQGDCYELCCKYIDESYNLSKCIPKMRSVKQVETHCKYCNSKKCKHVDGNAEVEKQLYKNSDVLSTEAGKVSDYSLYGIKRKHIEIERDLMAICDSECTKYENCAAAQKKEAKKAPFKYNLITAELPSSRERDDYKYFVDDYSNYQKSINTKCKDALKQSHLKCKTAWKSYESCPPKHEYIRPKKTNFESTVSISPSMIPSVSSTTLLQPRPITDYDTVLNVERKEDVTQVEHAIKPHSYTEVIIQKSKHQSYVTDHCSHCCNNVMPRATKKKNSKIIKSGKKPFLINVLCSKKKFDVTVDEIESGQSSNKQNQNKTETSTTERCCYCTRPI